MGVSPKNSIIETTPILTSPPQVDYDKAIAMFKQSATEGTVVRFLNTIKQKELSRSDK